MAHEQSEKLGILPVPWGRQRPPGDARDDQLKFLRNPKDGLFRNTTESCLGIHPLAVLDDVLWRRDPELGKKGVNFRIAEAGLQLAANLIHESKLFGNAHGRT